MTNDYEEDRDRTARFSNDIENKRQSDQSENRFKTENLNKLNNCIKGTKKNSIEKPADDKSKTNSKNEEYKLNSIQTLVSQPQINGITWNTKNKSETVINSDEARDFTNKTSSNLTDGSMVNNFIATNIFEKSSSNRLIDPSSVETDQCNLNKKSTDACPVQDPPPIIVNSLLCFVKNYFSLFCHDVIIEGILKTYSSEEIFTACFKLKELAPPIDPQQYTQLNLKDEMSEVEKTAHCIMFIFKQTANFRALPMFVSEDLHFPNLQVLEDLNLIVEIQELNQLVSTLGSEVLPAENVLITSNGSEKEQTEK